MRDGGDWPEEFIIGRASHGESVQVVKGRHYPEVKDHEDPEVNDFEDDECAECADWALATLSQACQGPHHLAICIVALVISCAISTGILVTISLTGHAETVGIAPDDGVEERGRLVRRDGKCGSTRSPSRPVPLDDYLPLSYESQVICREPKFNRSCLFQNLYWYRKNWYLFMVKGTPLPRCGFGVRLSAKHGNEMIVAVKWWPSLEKLNRFVRMQGFQTWGNLTVIFDSLWHFNIAHALFDGLYPAFLALRKFGLHYEPYASVIGIIPYQTEALIEEIWPRFGGLGVKFRHKLLRRGVDVSVRMPVAIAGSKNLGQRNMNAEVELPGGRDLQGTTLFRERMFSSHGMSLTVSAPGRGRGIIVHNKRFTYDEGMALSMITHVNGMEFEYVDWQSIRPFSQHLITLLDVVVHASAPGTAQFYQLFLQDGSVHVNLGAVSKLRQARIPWFMEVYLANAAPYLRALYYNSSSRLCGLHQDRVLDLLKLAVALHNQSFQMPVPPGVNLSPEGLAFKELCANNHCEELLESMNVADRGPRGDPKYPGICFFDAWVEFVVYEQGGWNTNGWRDGLGLNFCPLDRALLRKVREKFGNRLAPIIPTNRSLECSDEGFLVG